LQGFYGKTGLPHCENMFLLLDNFVVLVLSQALKSGSSAVSTPSS
jgi:hypothetical protein